VLGAWAEHLSPTPHSSQSLAALAHLGVTEERAVAEILQRAEGLGLVVGAGARFVPGNHSQDVFQRLGLALNAVAYYKEEVHQDNTLARVVLTKPPRPCLLEEELQKQGWRAFEIDPTDRAFKRIVQSAKSRVVVMTPFLDVVGAHWLRELFEDIDERVTKVLVLRSLERPSSPDFPAGYGMLEPWLVAHGVHVYNYSIPRPGGVGRETFHAKVVLCDDVTAYVGSSNVTAASLEHSMEMGVELSGKAARDVSSIVGAVLDASTKYLPAASQVLGP